jgi:hypothetical protein
VVLLAAFAAAGIFQWWGSMLGEAVREGPFGWLDRSAGVAIGAGIGLAVSAALLLALLLAPWPRTLGDQAAHARLSAPLMRAGARAAEFATRWIPGGAAVRDGFVAAERRTRK